MVRRDLTLKRLFPLSPPFSSYLVDGNAYFFTAVDISRRLEFTNNTRTIVVGIGYPPGEYVYDFRRGPDLTPPSSENDDYEVQLGRDGRPRGDLSFGGAYDFLEWIQIDVMSYVEGTLFPGIDHNGHGNRKALFGHSYGGIFALSTMFTRPGLFDAYIAASPVIWWNRDFLVRQLEAAFAARRKPVNPPLSLVLTWGGTGEQDLVRRHGESDEEFAERRENAENERMRESATAMADRLGKCPSLGRIWTREFEGEDHGSAAVTGLQYGMTQFVLSMA